MRKKQVGVYRTVFPSFSEPFISEQMRHMQGYQPIIISRKLHEAVEVESISVSEHDPSGLKQILFTLTRSLDLFKDKERLRSLALLHAHFGPDGVYALSLARRLGVPCLVTFHGFDATMNRMHLLLKGSPTGLTFLARERELKNGATAFIAVSDFIKAEMIAKGYPEAKIVTHYIGVDTQRFRPLPSPRDERYILCVGRHTQVKGVETLIRAFGRISEKHPGVLVKLVGEGELTQRLLELTSKLKLSDRILFLGPRPHADVLYLMQRAEVFSLPSQRSSEGASEALGIVFNEASACGIPIVATRHGGIPEAVRDGETGLLARENDPEALAEKLDILLSDRALGREMGRRGREYVCEWFDIRRQTAELEKIYDRLSGTGQG